MKNLAGNKLCDSYIAEELSLAGILITDFSARSSKEVPASIYGELNNFRFERAWYYWVVSGNMPLKYAKELYDKYKDLNIRVAGYCGNPPPDEWSESLGWYEKAQPHLDKFFNHEISYEQLEETGNSLKNEGEQYITLYHIDTQEGLKKFAEMIKNNNIWS
jgi:hypothetical protein